MYRKADSAQWPAAAALWVVFFLTGCESVEDKQLKACVEDIKLSLNDPGSLEVLSTETRPGEGEAFHLVVEVTAKNKFAGRERASVSCGFKSKNATTLDPEEFQNKLRDIQRTFEKAGLRLN